MSKNHRNITLVEFTKAELTDKSWASYNPFRIDIKLAAFLRQRKLHGADVAFPYITQKDLDIVRITNHKGYYGESAIAYTISATPEIWDKAKKAWQAIILPR
jgi:5-formyltetrahydrofolate cyclo-ligase